MHKIYQTKQIYIIFKKQCLVTSKLNPYKIVNNNAKML